MIYMYMCQFGLVQNLHVECKKGFLNYDLGDLDNLRSRPSKFNHLRSFHDVSVPVWSNSGHLLRR